MHEQALHSLVAARRRERGFSMAEVLVATALMSVILLALFGLVTAGVHRAYGGKKMTEGAVLAEAVMERVNIPVPHTAFDPGGAATGRTRTWTKTGAASITEAVESGSTNDVILRNSLRTLLLEAPLHASTARPATLVVTMTPVGAGGADLTNCSLIRITVDLTWWDRGVRRRNVFLQALNVRIQD